MRTGSRLIEVTSNVLQLDQKKVSTQELTSTARKASIDAINASRKVSQGDATHSEAVEAHSNAAITWAKLADVQRTGMKPGGKLAMKKQKFHEQAATWHTRQGGMSQEVGMDSTSQGKKPKGKKGDASETLKPSVKPTKNSAGVRVLKDSVLSINAWSDEAREASAKARAAHSHDTHMQAGEWHQNQADASKDPKVSSAHQEAADAHYKAAKAAKAADEPNQGYVFGKQSLKNYQSAKKKAMDASSKAISTSGKVLSGGDHARQASERAEKLTTEASKASRSYWNKTGSGAKAEAAHAAASDAHSQAAKVTTGATKKHHLEQAEVHRKINESFNG